jgi:hypothetical protein
MLVWHQQVLGWLKRPGWTPALLQRAMDQHIETTVARCRGRMDTWDVVNEPFTDQGDAVAGRGRRGFDGQPPLQRPARPAPPPDLRHRRPRLPHPPTPAPRGRARRPPSNRGSLISLYQAQRDLQTALACWHGYCPACQRRLPP